MRPSKQMMRGDAGHEASLRRERLRWRLDTGDRGTPNPRQYRR
jgi:hypothetical protein